VPNAWDDEGCKPEASMPNWRSGDGEKVNRRHRAICIGIVLVLTIGTVTASRAITPPNAPDTGQKPTLTPVLVELFTSEGCSDCPPADALLAFLDRKQPIPGVDAIVLSEHVTYWDHQGWRDPFSLDAIDVRQREYARQFALSDVYTPQIVVDGAAQLVGSNGPKLQAEIERAASRPKLAIAIVQARQAPGGAVEFALNADTGGKANVVAAVAENATVTEVAHGENAGRTLHHVAVVRVMKDFGPRAADGQTLELKGREVADAKASATPLRLVVFLVSRNDGRVLGAAAQIVRP
jgi:hypothetical protein